MTDQLWYVVHTRPRCEKKIVQECEREGISPTLPLFKVVRKYRGKTVVFEKPLFPGYVFVNATAEQIKIVRRSDYLANLLEVFDQVEFSYQLEEILFALESGLEIKMAPQIGEGTMVRIKGGPLRGLEGWVEQRYGPTTVLLRLDFIGQAAAVRVEAEHLEIV